MLLPEGEYESWAEMHGVKAQTGTEYGQLEQYTLTTVSEGEGEISYSEHDKSDHHVKVDHSKLGPQKSKTKVKRKQNINQKLNWGEVRRHGGKLRQGRRRPGVTRRKRDNDDEDYNPNSESEADNDEILDATQITDEEDLEEDPYLAGTKAILKRRKQRRKKRRSAEDSDGTYEIESGSESEDDDADKVIESDDEETNPQSESEQEPMTDALEKRNTEGMRKENKKKGSKAVETKRKDNVFPHKIIRIPSPGPKSILKPNGNKRGRRNRKNKKEDSEDETASDFEPDTDEESSEEDMKLEPESDDEGVAAQGIRRKHLLMKNGGKEKENKNAENDGEIGEEGKKFIVEDYEEGEGKGEEQEAEEGEEPKRKRRRNIEGAWAERLRPLV